MKRISLILAGLLLIPTLFLTSCDKGDDTQVVETPQFTTMKNYMLANELDVNNILGGPTAEPTNFVVGAPASADLTTFLAKYYIIDIRTSADFKANSIQGAKNVAFADILTEGAAAVTAGKPVLVVCYTGQTACYATALMRLYGFKKTQALKWGMSGWNTTTDKYTSNIKNIVAAEGTKWNYNAAPANLVHIEPTISTLGTDGQSILKRRVEAVVAAGFGPAQATSTAVFAAPTTYNLYNYFNQRDWDGFGHFAGAYKVEPTFSLAANTHLSINNSATAKAVIYCYTGQTSAVLTACLRVLGYDAYTLMFGMNGLQNGHPHWPIPKNQWGVDSTPKALPMVVTP